MNSNSTKIKNKYNCYKLQNLTLNINNNYTFKTSELDSNMHLRCLISKNNIDLILSIAK